MNSLSFLCDGSLIDIFQTAAITDILKGILSSSPSIPNHPKGVSLYLNQHLLLLQKQY